jgi:hypothetical protein
MQSKRFQPALEALYSAEGSERSKVPPIVFPSTETKLARVYLVHFYADDQSSTQHSQSSLPNQHKLQEASICSQFTIIRSQFAITSSQFTITSSQSIQAEQHDPTLASRGLQQSPSQEGSLHPTQYQISTRHCRIQVYHFPYSRADLIQAISELHHSIRAKVLSSSQTSTTQVESAFIHKLYSIEDVISSKYLRSQASRISREQFRIHDNSLCIQARNILIPEWPLIFPSRIQHTRAVYCTRFPNWAVRVLYMASVDVC